MTLAVVILAAGQGTRMRSRLPKVLQPLGGQPLLQHVVSAAEALSADSLHIVYGHGGAAVQQHFADSQLFWAEQKEQLGTGHAVQQALPNIADDQTVLVLYGDVPLVKTSTLAALVEAASDGPAILTVVLDDPSGYGRIVRDDSASVTAIVEQKDATAEQQAIQEINTGLIAANAGDLKRWLANVSNDNAQAEYYLTDIVELAVADGKTVVAVQSDDAAEVEGINNRSQLAIAERNLQRQRVQQLLDNGVTVIDPARLDIRGSLTCGKDVLLDVGVVINGDVSLADGVEVGPYSVLTDCRVAAETKIKSHSVLEQCDVGKACNIGPFARLRPHADLADSVNVGNFVEIKKSTIGDGSKVNHLSYIGDAEIGSGVNVGAGTITCNYDGANKFRTVIRDGAFIGSDTQLVAPVTVGQNATVGAGTTVTKDIPDAALAITRSPQRHVDGWQRPVKKK